MKQHIIEELVDRYQNELFSFAFYTTGALAEAQDIVQEVFIRYFDKGVTAANPRAYLYRSVSNACNDYLRRESRRRSFPIEQAGDLPDNSPNRELYGEYERIERLLDGIPPDQAEVIRLKTLGEMSFAEIAEVMELPVTTVKSRFKYGIEKVRDLLNK